MAVVFNCVVPKKALGPKLPKPPLLEVVKARLAAARERLADSELH